MKYETVRQLLDSQADDHADRPFMLDDQGAVTTFSEARRQARRVAADLHARGIRPGDSVAYAMYNSPACALTILGILYGGYRATAINLVAGASTVAYVLAHSEARLVLSRVDAIAVMEEALGSMDAAGRPELIDIDSVVLADDGIVPEAPGASDPALLMYTSGSTGTPKGVVLRQSSLCHAGLNPTLAHGLTSRDRALCVLPMYHINGLCTTLLAPLYSGGSVVYPPRFSVKTFFPVLTALNCTWFSAVPTHISWLTQHLREHPPATAQFDHVRFGRSASAPLAPESQAAFERLSGIAIVETMGLTETAGQIASNPMPPGVRKSGSVGLAVGNELRIADAAQASLPAGEVGEILIRGDNVLDEYLKNPQATRESITDDGWFRTGDLGRLDADGYLFVTGRLKELIIKGGENIAPREIDDVLMQHPDVVEAAAFGRPCRDYGQQVEAAVRIAEDSEVTEAQLLALCRQEIGKFKSPGRIHFLPELPKGPSMKIQRHKLPEICVG